MCSYHIFPMEDKEDKLISATYHIIYIFYVKQFSGTRDKYISLIFWGIESKIHTHIIIREFCVQIERYIDY